MKQYNVTTEAEFQQIMESIDQELRDENRPITARSMLGWLKYSSRFGLGLRMPAPQREPREGGYTGYDLTIRIFNWFDERYGDRQNVDFATGEMAILIRNDLYKFRFPTMMGQVLVTCDPQNFGKESPSALAGPNDPPPTTDVLNSIDEFTAALANSLSKDELNHLFLLWNIGYRAFVVMREVSGEALVKQALGDIQASVAHLFSNPSQYGSSKWASLQATEKIIKAYIRKKGENHKWSHSLDELATHAETLGLPPIPRQLLDSIQCKAEVRYDDAALTLQEAVAAHQDALSVCEGVARSILGRSPLNIKF